MKSACIWLLAGGLLAGSLSMAPLPPLPLAPAQAQSSAVIPVTVKRYALVVGNSAYTESPLDNPVNDAT
ncbi:MAG: hypothetical protein ACAI44_26945, partial [Candidatus Sericytochromatia bacterium]